MCTQCQVAMYPNAQGQYEFEGFRPGPNPEIQETEKQSSKDNETADDGIVDLLDMEIPEDQEEIIKKTLEEKTKYKEVKFTFLFKIHIFIQNSHLFKIHIAIQNSHLISRFYSKFTFIFTFLFKIHI